MSEITLPDEKQLKEFTKRLRQQYQVEPGFVALHPHAQTDTGIYEFQLATNTTEMRRCFYWRFVPTVAGGQLAMDVTEKSSTTPEEVVAQWLATRKKADKARG